VATAELIDARAAARPGGGRWSFAALLAFVALVYSNPGNLIPGLGEAGLAKAAAGCALAALGGAHLLGDRRLRVGGALGSALCALFAWMGLSSLWSYAPAASVSALLDGLKYLAVFLLIANLVDSTARARVAVHAIALASAIPALGAINAWLHGEHLVDGDRAGWIGIFANPNDLCEHLAIGLALALGGRAIARARWLKLAYLPAIAAMATAALLTQSRGGLLASSVVVALWALRGARALARRGRLAVGVGAALLLAVEIAPEATWQRAETAFDYREDASAQGRIDAWRTGLNVLAERPFSGVGAGAFLVAWPDFAPGDAGAPRTAHNTFIQLVGETGLPALALFGLALAVAFIELRRASTGAPDDDARTLARAVHGGLIGFVVCSLTGGYAYSWPLYFLLGLAAALGSLAPRARGGA
jgi:O-antigen ligase